MKKIIDLYEEGRSYKEYIDSADEEVRQKHLHYLEKMKLTEEERERLSAIKDDKRLLVFADTYCNDCRIMLAVLENMSQSCHKLHYRIVSGRGNEDLMRHLGGGIGIPLVVPVRDDNIRKIFKEYPDVVHEKMEGAGSDETDKLIKDFRSGLYKNDMLEQLISGITAQ